MKLVTVLKTAMVTVSIIALLLGGTALAKEGKKAEQGWIGITGLIVQYTMRVCITTG